MDTTQCPQENIMVKPLATNTNTSEKKPRPEKPQPINCPRCDSINTKFCYYNNYSLTQPRYYCKTCRRYWTQGGSIRNIPVGGGTRKSNKSIRSSSNLVSNVTKNLPIPIPIPIPSSILVSSQNKKHYEQGQNLNLDFTSAYSPSFSSLEVLTGITPSRGFNSFMPVQLQGDSISNTSTIGLPLQDFKQVPMNFSFDGVGGNGYVNGYGNEGRVLLPSNNNTTLGLDQQGYTSGFWNGMLGGDGYHGN